MYIIYAQHSTAQFTSCLTNERRLKAANCINMKSSRSSSSRSSTITTTTTAATTHQERNNSIAKEKRSITLLRYMVDEIMVVDGGDVVGYGSGYGGLDDDGNVRGGFALAMVGWSGF